MGNCITSTAINPAVNNTAAASQSSSTFRTEKRVQEEKEKKVRFRLGEKETTSIKGGESCRETKTGVVRIRLVLTQNELNQILNAKLNGASAEELLSVIQSRSKRDSRGRSSSSDLEGNGNWMPALESIPEDI